ncbi:MAG: N-acetylneuraminate synthase family protein [Candidatus Omnitrophota bacterium]
MKSKKRVYIIAEAGINHNNSLDNCYGLIDSASDAGCNAVKFQFFTARGLYPRSAGRLNWRDGSKGYSYDIYSAVKSFELPRRWIADIMRYSRRKGIDFLSSVSDARGADELVRLGVKMIKIPSYSVTNLPLLDHCARLGLPMIMSTGGASLGEVEEAVRTVNAYHNKLSILHCSIKYPTEPGECNLGVIVTLRYAFPYNRIGYSDHTAETSSAPVQAVYLGADIIEKHITLDRHMKGPDHFFALEPRQLKEMVCAVRDAEKDRAKGNMVFDRKMYGSSAKVTFAHERYLRDFCYPGLFARKCIKKGERILFRDLSILRPGKKGRGLEPRYLSLFKRYKIRAARDIAEEEEIKWESIFDA